ncbi:hypothetical protein ASE00_04855 [Sphingomonas sp. Root710]|uniref:L,D-transpeptidase family protein n=1 Tax=Sphingomonas sp. Root710 TaxID=1736594 RepID=UPI0006F75A02|nr:L,D-transpeptidase family protein [Sphingomonas sp. Root710]KRB86074.1 hypothetical protein ASE00_04855 [Sphingomonas sp. Root710]
MNVATVSNPSIAFARRRSPRARARVGLVAFAVAALALFAMWLVRPDWQSLPLRSALAEAARDVPAPVEDFYRRRGYEPLWSEPSGFWPFRRARLIPEAELLATRITEAMPKRRDVSAAVRAARGGDVEHVAQAELVLSRAFGDYRRSLHDSVAPARLAWLDPALAPPRDTAGVLEEVARAPSRRRYLDLIERVNPMYDALRRGLAEYRADWSRLPQNPVADGPALAAGATGPRVKALRHRLGLADAGEAPFDAPLASAVRRFQNVHGLPATGHADRATIAALNRGAASYERLIRANLDRAQAFPTSFDGRLLFVNVAAAQLSLIEQGEVRETMRVVAGSPAMPTPAMAGEIRYAVFDPYWNVPVDLVRDRLAPQVLRQGPSYFEQRGFEALSDWVDGAHRLDPRAIDWRAVAQGRIDLRVRQRPGGGNEMGRVKFMLPNELGIYLHDSPHRALFGQARRWVSAGCVRLQDADKVASWLLGHGIGAANRAAPDRHVDLPHPTPVYIAYLTAAPTGDGIVFYPDVYGRDPALLAAMGAT